MRKAILSCLAMALIACMPYRLAFAAGEPPKAGGALPPISLPVPEKSSERKYLGIPEGKYFGVSQIRAKVVIVEIFSMYCPYCQREAPKVNRLYKEIEGNLKLKGKIKMIGIGAGNSSFEVDVFRKKYDIRFPLFSDEDFSLHKMFGEVRTPYFLGVKINPGGGNQVIYSKPGGFKGVDSFLETILKHSGADP
jgi:thiol-disulfide isomerase/thioredoxin